MEYINWQDYIHNRIISSGNYFLMSTDIKSNSLIYIHVYPEIKTELRVDYYENYLIDLKFYHPETHGYNKMIESEYFYREDFNPDSSYGDSGLEFNKINIEGIEELMSKGVIGIEEQFYNDGVLVKTILTIEEFDFSMTRYHENEGCFYSLWKPLVSIFRKENYSYKKSLLLEYYLLGLDKKYQAKPNHK